jgi:hypothetical protein
VLARPDLAANLEPTDKSYVVACRNAERASQARVRRVRVLVGGLALLIALGGVGWWQQEFLKDQYQWRVVMGASANRS